MDCQPVRTSCKARRKPKLCAIAVDDKIFARSYGCCILRSISSLSEFDCLIGCLLTRNRTEASPASLDRKKLLHQRDVEKADGSLGEWPKLVLQEVIHDQGATHRLRFNSAPRARGGKRATPQV